MHDRTRPVTSSEPYPDYDVLNKWAGPSWNDKTRAVVARRLAIAPELRFFTVLEFETVSASLRVPFWRTFMRVTLPVCLPAVLDIAMYLFVNAMTTVSAVVFIYAPHTTLAAIAVLNMDDAGDVAPAAAMAMVVFATAAVTRAIYMLLTQGYLARAQMWRKR